jgi:hypothetical protein
VRHQPEAEDWLKQTRKLPRDPGDSEIAEEVAEYLRQTNRIVITEWLSLSGYQ